jgi:Reverse transcriptase (RNA-dependent DNA polymerase)
VTRLTAGLIDQLDLGEALKEELEYVPDLLPKQIVDRALAVNAEGVSEYIRQLAVAGVPVEPAAKVVALKWRHGRRTVAALPLYERVLYRAVVQSIAEDLMPRVRGQEAYAEFQAEPLSHQGVEYIVMTDLTNYYDSIDIDRLSQELLRRTGQWAQVDWLGHFWTVTSDGFGGIPQMSPTSDVVADTYADLLHRALLREGLAVWRYADDFRIACRSYGDCVAALEILDELARGLGLTVNERKTLTPSRDKYRDIIEGPQRRLELINEAVREELTQVDFYDWSEVSPEEADIFARGRHTSDGHLVRRT